MLSVSPWLYVCTTGSRRTGAEEESVATDRCRGGPPPLTCCSHLRLLESVPEDKLCVESFESLTLNFDFCISSSRFQDHMISPQKKMFELHFITCLVPPVFFLQALCTQAVKLPCCWTWSWTPDPRAFYLLTARIILRSFSLSLIFKLCVCGGGSVCTCEWRCPQAPEVQV